jgi:hypothetical protein
MRTFHPNTRKVKDLKRVMGTSNLKEFTSFYKKKNKRNLLKRKITKNIKATSRLMKQKIKFNKIQTVKKESISDRIHKIPKMDTREITLMTMKTIFQMILSQ